MVRLAFVCALMSGACITSPQTTMAIESDNFCNLPPTVRGIGQRWFPFLDRMM